MGEFVISWELVDLAIGFKNPALRQSGEDTTMACITSYNAELLGAIQKMVAEMKKGELLV